MPLIENLPWIAIGFGLGIAASIVLRLVLASREDARDAQSRRANPGLNE